MLKFAIIGARGSCLANQIWDAEAKPGLSIAASERGLTLITKETSDVTYLVANGTTDDFKKLRKGRGFSTGERRTLNIESNFAAKGSVSCSIVILEYDQSLNRLGQIKVNPNSKARLVLRAATAFAVATIRLSGTGSLEIQAFSIGFSETESLAPGPSTSYFTPVKAEEDSDHLSLGSIQEISYKLEMNIDELQQALYRIADTPAMIKGKASGINARDDGAISETRENWIKVFLSEMAKRIPSSNGCAFYEKIPLRTGVIADESMFNFYKDVFQECVYLSPDNYLKEFEKKNFDLILYVTCWKGLNEEEWKGIKYREKPKSAFESILELAHQSGAKTVFQTIEDPSNFDYFLPIAEKMDYVFTSDTDCIERYKEKLGHNRVFYGEYGVNTQVNNPIGSLRHSFNAALFSGSYPERYAERCEDMKVVLSSITNREYHLLIIDRNFNSSEFLFPPEFQSSIIGAFEHAELQKIHKLFSYSLNFNSIKQSPTMCAMRVYELQAQAKPLISNYAKSVFNKFPEIRIIPVHSSVKAPFENRASLNDLILANRAMYRMIYHHNAFAAVQKMLGNIGVDDRGPAIPRILVLADGDVDIVRQFVADQRFVSADIRAMSSVDEISNLLAAYDFVAVMSSSIRYSPWYLISRLSAFIYTDSEFVCQIEPEDWNNPKLAGHEYVGSSDNRFTSMVKVGMGNEVAFLTGELQVLNGKGYALPWFEARRCATLPDAQHLATSEFLLTVIVPVHNNGRFLEAKCLSSLQRNECWAQMEVLLIDDGSTDEHTTKTCLRLQDEYPNVRAVQLGGTGSGSASRPRNVGMELASAPLISFLDPDNEISEFGYDRLLQEFEEQRLSGRPVDFVSGFQVKVADSVITTGKHAGKEKRVVNDPLREFFQKGIFPVVSSQAAVIDREFIHRNKIQFVEGAIGQDTFFGWELLARSHRAVFLSSAFIIYYAQRAGSVTNLIGTNFFKRCLSLEKVQSRMLGELGLLEYYLDHHYENFMKDWYIKRLDAVQSEERSECEDLLAEIASLYGRELRMDDDQSGISAENEVK